MIGVHFVDQHVATGFGIHLAQPIFRSEWRDDMTLEEGQKLLEKALLVLFYRDRSAINKIQVSQLLCHKFMCVKSFEFNQFT